MNRVNSSPSRGTPRVEPDDPSLEEIQDEGVALPFEPILNFVGGGVSVVNDPGNNRNNVNIAAGVPLTRTLTAGAGLTGGGDLSADRTFNVGQNADNSVVVNADDVQVNPTIQAGAAAGATAVQPTRTLTAGAGLTGGGDLSANRTFDVGANADGSIVVNADDIQVAPALQAAAAAGGTAVQPARTLTAGAGLTGGGDLSADRTFDVGANADGSIVVNANDIQVSAAIQAGAAAGATAVQSSTLHFGAGTLTVGAGPRYLPAWFGAVAAGESVLVVPRAGTLRGLTVRVGAAGAALAENLVYTVRVNGADTGVTLTLAANALGPAFDNVNTAAVAQGDFVSLGVTGALTNTPQGVFAGIELAQ